MTFEMEAEDYLSLKDQQLAAQEEQIDKLLAALRERDCELARKTEQLKRLTMTLDDVLGLVRSRELIAKARGAQSEAIEL